MNVQVAVLCDAATEENLKLSLLGAFDTIGVRALPAVIPQCSVVLRGTLFSPDEGKHVLKLNFVDADGRSIMPPLGFALDVAMPEDSHFGTRNFIFHLQQLKFDHAGLYSVDATLDDQALASIPLVVKLLPPPAEA
jgi:hypothetical protein